MESSFPAGDSEPEAANVALVVFLVVVQEAQQLAGCRGLELPDAQTDREVVDL